MKKFVYITAAGFLGFLLSVLLHSAVEVLYLRSLLAQDTFPTWITLFGKLEALPLWMVLLLAVAGIAFGVWLGFTWWRIVYVEKRHWRFNKQQE